MLCLNMIVRNESARLLRALDAVRPYIGCFAILDTGSTDNTVALIQNWGEQHCIPGIVGQGAFVNFSQARNDALTLARSYCQRFQPDADYLLLQDADMELQIDNPDWVDEIAGADAYDMIQKAGTTSYHNVRLLSVRSTATYTGVTHEYLPPGGGVIRGAHFIDHADGANRGEKYERDIKLLADDLQRDPNNPRSLFYLGNSYRDAGNPRMAITTYERYLQVSNWPEEAWTAQSCIAHCYRDLGDMDRFITEMLKAYSMRPSRAEALYDLALHFRSIPNQQALAMLFIEKGITVPKPEDDKLFVNDFVYSAGFREEFSICGFYTEKRERAMHITNGLALDASVPEHVRRGARMNMVHYLRPLQDMAPSATHSQFKIGLPEGFVGMNPSITNDDRGRLEMILRTVNYRIDEHGRYMIGELGCQDAPIVTRNYFFKLSKDYYATDVNEVQWGRPDPKFNLVIGLEDMRVFWHNGHRRFSACVREQSDTGMPEQWRGLLADSGSVVGADAMSDGTSCEKNWAPLSIGSDLRWMYRLNMLVNTFNQLEPLTTPLAVDNISGSSQWVPWRGGYLAVVHEALVHPGTGKRVYQHRFAFYDATITHLRLSLPFVFQALQIEFCAGIAKKPQSDSYVVSYGVRDEEAWLTEIHDRDIAAMIFGAH